MQLLKQFTALCILSAGFYGCQNGSNEHKEDAMLQAGVSQELAHYRKQNLKDIEYQLFFRVPEKNQEALKGKASITCSGKQEAFILDFKAPEAFIDSVCMNGHRVNFKFENEHIRVTDTMADEQNTVNVYFTCPDQSLNRRDQYLYTLLVPDRARTVFPCFDQPDLKATYELSLDLPSTWKAVANGPVKKEKNEEKTGRTLVSYEKTLPISTYLFSFVAGEMEQVAFTRGERTVNIYHRESDPDKVAQCEEIANQIFNALEWMEEFTQIPHPFPKYDCILIPGFQFGGMEHPGAILYNAPTMFLNKQATLREQLNRAAVIAHETAHMWFGDLVTMKWFDDVWTKEVFANFFASLIVEPHYPTMNHQLNFLLDYLPGAFGEERTTGTNSIKQDLDNLANAGLVYGMIIYQKSPIVMNMLYNRMGKEAFRKGMQEYLKKYAFGNANWDDLIAILDEQTTEDLKSWSRCWVNEKGRPTLEARIEGQELVVTQSDEWNRGVCWPQKLSYLICADGKEESVTVDFPDDKQNVVRVALPTKIAKPEEAVILPNVDAKGYGLFTLNEAQHQAMWKAISAHQGKNAASEVLRASLLINLYENLCKGNVSPKVFRQEILSYLEQEDNALLFSLGMGYLTNCQRNYLSDQAEGVEKPLWRMIQKHEKAASRLQAFRCYRAAARTPEAIDHLYQVWKERRLPDGSNLSEGDCMRLSYELAIHLPQQADAILAEQLKRITNADRQKQFTFISAAASPSQEKRDSVFQMLLQKENRRIEPWAGEALALLNHPLRSEEAIKYIRPALEAVQEVQRTGDIFFPRLWAQSLLAGHTSQEAADEVNRFFADHPDYPLMLGNKIKQQAGHLKLQK